MRQRWSSHRTRLKSNRRGPQSLSRRLPVGFSSSTLPASAPGRRGASTGRRSFDAPGIIESRTPGHGRSALRFGLLRSTGMVTAPGGRSHRRTTEETSRWPIVAAKECGSGVGVVRRSLSMAGCSRHHIATRRGRASSPSIPARTRPRSSISRRSFLSCARITP